MTATQTVNSYVVAEAFEAAARSKAEAFALAKVPDRAEGYAKLTASYAAADRVICHNNTGDHLIDLIESTMDVVVKDLGIEVDEHYLGGGEVRYTWWMKA